MHRFGLSVVILYDNFCVDLLTQIWSIKSNTALGQCRPGSNDNFCVDLLTQIWSIKSNTDLGQCRPGSNDIYSVDLLTQI